MLEAPIAAPDLPDTPPAAERAMRILVVDDSTAQRLFMKATLVAQGHEVIQAADGAEGVRLFGSADPDLVLMDVMMPGIDGLEAARRIRSASDQWVPIIFLSGRSGGEAVGAGIAAGGDDYLVKPVDPEVLTAKIHSMARIAAMRRELVARTAELRDANAALQRLVDVDGLTGIANRRRLDRALTDEIARARRNAHPLAVVLIDIDHFKRFNDTHGHLAGDECLRSVARTLEAGVVRPADLAARYGGEEFCALLPQTDAAGALLTAERLRVAVESTLVDTSAGPLSVTGSFGVVALAPGAAATPAQLLADADQALYRAKQQGRNRVELAGHD